VPVADAELAKYWCGTHSENAPRARASLDAIRCKAVLYRSPGSSWVVTAVRFGCIAPCAAVAAEMPCPQCAVAHCGLYERSTHSWPTLTVRQYWLAGTSGIGCSRALTTASSSTAMAGSRSLSECSQYTTVARDRSCTLARLTELFAADSSLRQCAGTHRRRCMSENRQKSYKLCIGLCRARHPELIAKHIAQRCARVGAKSRIIIDAFAGVGGNTIQFASLAHTHVRCATQRAIGSVQHAAQRVCVEHCAVACAAKTRAVAA
jgi:hypothetical protein